MEAGSICVLGAGSWGTALAILLAQQGKTCTLWAHNAKHLQQLANDRSNERYLTGVTFPDNLNLETDLQQAISDVDIILISVPSHAFRAILKSIKPNLQANQQIAWASKGLEAESHKLLSQILIEELGDNIPFAVLSGPTFAREVAVGLPTAITVASTDDEFAKKLADRLHTDTFRAYTCNDIVGVQIGGAVKNALAIAAGIADGLGFGANTRAALITRGLAEMSRLGHTLDAEPTTFMGLAGLGDLVLTCTDDQSRNRRFGKALAAGSTPKQAFTDIGQIVEGALTAKVVHEFAAELKVEMPICEQVYRVIYEGLPAKQAVTELLERRQKAE